MTEKLSGRIKRLIAANINEIVDQFERSNADAVMREAVREVDRALEEAREDLGHKMAARQRARNHLERIRVRIGEFKGKIDHAVAQDRDDLAEAAIARLIDLESQVPVLEKSFYELGDQQIEMEGLIAALKGRRHDMAEEFRAHLQSRPVAEGDIGGFEDGAGDPSANFDRRMEKAEQAFNRAMHGPLGIPGERSRDSETIAKLAELETVMRGQQIADRLAAAKAARKAPADAH